MIIISPSTSLHTVRVATRLAGHREELRPTSVLAVFGPSGGVVRSAAATDIRSHRHHDRSRRGACRRTISLHETSQLSRSRN